MTIAAVESSMEQGHSDKQYLDLLVVTSWVLNFLP